MPQSVAASVDELAAREIDQIDAQRKKIINHVFSVKHILLTGEYSSLRWITITLL